MNVKIKKLHPDAVIPKIATGGAACVDVVATEIINEGKHVTVKLGFSTEIPKGYKMCIAPRSSFTQKGWVMQNSPAQIDSDYRGEWMIKFQSIPTSAGWTRALNKYFLEHDIFPYKAGDRVAQTWLEKVLDFEFEEVEELDATDRGTGGFGSSGI